MIVVDTSVLAHLYLPTQHTPRAEALLEHDPDWVVPLLWRSEFRNVLVACMRRDAMSLQTAQRIELEAEDLLSGHEYETDSRLVLELARDSDCSAYDCEFVALAMRLEVRLVTMDARLLRVFPQRAVSLDAW